MKRGGGTVTGRLDCSEPNQANLPRSRSRIAEIARATSKVARAGDKKLRRLRRNAKHPDSFSYVPGELPLIEWIGLLDK